MQWASPRFSTALAILGDLQLATPADLCELVRRARAVPIVIVPDHDGTGTAALGLTPPGRIPPRFGPQSRRSHRDAAREAGCQADELHLSSLSQDMDVPSDLMRIDVRAAATSALLRTLNGRRELGWPPNRTMRYGGRVE